MNMKQYSIKINGKEFVVAIEETTLPQKKPTAATTVQAPTKPTALVSANPNDGQALTAPMPGTVLKLKVNDGATVKVGEAVIILEAMKMENEIAATTAGQIKFCVSEGDKINSGDIIARIV